MPETLLAPPENPPALADLPEGQTPPRSRRAEGIATVDRKCDRREQRFANLIANGWPQWKAYNAVSGAEKKDTCEKQGQRWFARACVQAEIQRLRNALTEETAMRRAEKRNVLANLARDDDTPPAVRVAAVQVDNRMTGEDEPLKVVHSGAVVFTIDPIERRDELGDVVDVGGVASVASVVGQAGSVAAPTLAPVPAPQLAAPAAQAPTAPATAPETASATPPARPASATPAPRGFL